jgi:hypothetical protein
MPRNAHHFDKTAVIPHAHPIHERHKQGLIFLLRPDYILLWNLNERAAPAPNNLIMGEHIMIIREHIGVTGKPAVSYSSALKSAVCLAALWAGAASAQEAAPAGGLDEIIVTGTATASGLKKLDTSFSVTSLSEEQIKETNPTAPADVLKLSPGVYVESSGGPGAGANVEVIGFPSNSLSPYVTMQIQGAALFPQAGMSFLEGPSYLRPDDSVQRVEMVQGGPAVLYGEGQPGLTANYLLKRGNDKPEGDIGVTYGSEVYGRVDGFLSGPLSKEAGLYGSIGGYWNKGNGIRDPQFTADQGGQVTATLAKDWDDGTLLVYGRYAHFNDEFVTDTPVILSGTGSNAKISSYPGFSPLTGTMSSKADQYLNLPISPCKGSGCIPGSLPMNQADGRAPQFVTVGAEFTWDFGHGLDLLDDLNYSTGSTAMDALYSSGVNPESIQAFATAQAKSDKLTGIAGINAITTNNGAPAPLGSNLLEAEVRYAMVKFHSESNEIHLSQEVFEGNTLTIGNITSLYGLSELYYTGAHLLLQAQNNPSPIDIALTNGSTTYQLTNSQGFLSGPSGANLDLGTGYNTAFFVSDSWKLGKWLFDAGMRAEREVLRETAENTLNGNYTSDPTLLWARGLSFAPGTVTYPLDQTASSYSVGANYEIDPSMSAYVRVNQGVHFLSFSDLTAGGFVAGGASPPVERAHNYEFGYKYQNPYIYADLAAFYRSFSNVPQEITSAALPNGQTGGVDLVYGSVTKGVEFQTTVTPFADIAGWKGLSLTASGDVAYGKYNSAYGCVTVTTNGVTRPVCNASYVLAGKLLARQPTFQMRVTPAYKIATDWGAVRLWTTVEYIGDRYGDMEEQDFLQPYFDVSFGITGDVGDHWQISLQGTNVTNSIGYTETNPRATVGIAPVPGPELARSIDGREINLQVKYQF